MEACYMAYSDFYEAEYESIAIKEMSHGSHLICATECIRRDLYSKLKYFAIGNGNKCMCAEDLPEKRVPGGSLKLVANTSCSLRCPGNHRESCDKFKQGAKVYPVLPSSMEACYMAYSDFYEAEYESIAIKEMSHGSHLICATECIRRDLYSKLKYFAIGNGNKCMCAEDLPEKRVPGGSLKLVANTSCSLRCPGNHRESCDKFKQGAKVYPVLPSSMEACYMAYSDFYEAEYESIAIKEMSHGSHLICATECIRRDLYSKLKYFAIGNGNKCMCAEDLPEKRVPGGSLKLVANTSCSLRCPGNHRESCGGLYNLAYFRLSSTLTPPKTGEFYGGMLHGI
uniref:WSC domain-containing protein n=1 Tax=Macrostomum lignano TaxID=282301 RepID=A0A1I8J5S1_9PLAT